MVEHSSFLSSIDLRYTINATTCRFKLISCTAVGHCSAVSVRNTVYNGFMTHFVARSALLMPVTSCGPRLFGWLQLAYAFVPGVVGGQK